MIRISDYETPPGFDLHSPATDPVLRSFMGAFGKRLFERSEFPIAAHKASQYRKKAGGGVIYFGYFLLDKQKKVNSPVARERQRSFIGNYNN